MHTALSKAAKATCISKMRSNIRYGDSTGWKSERLIRVIYKRVFIQTDSISGKIVGRCGSECLHE